MAQRNPIVIETVIDDGTRVRIVGAEDSDTFRITTDRFGTIVLTAIDEEETDHGTHRVPAGH